MPAPFAHLRTVAPARRHPEPETTATPGLGAVWFRGVVALGLISLTGILSACGSSSLAGEDREAVPPAARAESVSTVAQSVVFPAAVASRQVDIREPTTDGASSATVPSVDSGSPGANPVAVVAIPPPVPFEAAVLRAGDQLLRTAAQSLGAQPRELVIDPLIDAATGAQTRSSVDMGAQLARRIEDQHPQWQVKPFTRAALARSPLLLIGSLTAVNSGNDAGQRADAFRIWLTLVDLKTGRIVAKQLDRATAHSVNATPTRYFTDSPTWHKDRTVNAYLNSCQVNSKVGDPVDPAYMMRLPAAAVINEAILAYNEGKLEGAYQLYRDAAVVAESDDLRVLNGLYLTSWRLGRRDEAGAAFERIVAAGLEATRLPLKLLFTTGSTQFLAVSDMPAQYSLWLRAVAGSSGRSASCLQVVGHASRTGRPELNDQLSLRRATAVAESLQKEQPGLARRLTPVGKGSRETLIGLGTDDLRDALDRRVEFRVVPCIGG